MTKIGTGIAGPAGEFRLQAWHHRYVSVVLLIVGLVVLIAAVYVATGRGGELSAERADHAPLDLGPASATDVALLRPPTAMWGYDMHATDEALGQIAESIRERDVRIVALEQMVTDLSRNAAPVTLGDPFPGVRAEQALQAAPAREQAPAPQREGARERATSAPPAWPQQPARSRPPEAARQQQSSPQPGQLPQRQPQQQRQSPPERSHG